MVDNIRISVSLIALLASSSCGKSAPPPTGPEPAPARAASPPSIATGHGEVTAVAFAPSGDTLVTGGTDHTIKLWRVEDGALLHTLVGHGGVVGHIQVGPRERLVATSSDDSVRVWEMSSGGERAVIPRAPGGVLVAAFDPSGSRVAAALGGGAMKIIATDGGATLCDLHGTGGAIHSIAFHPDEPGRLVTTDAGGTLRRWDIDRCAEVDPVAGLTSGPSVDALAFSPDGRRVAFAGPRGIHVWDNDAGAMAQTIGFERIGMFAFGLDWVTPTQLAAVEVSVSDPYDLAGARGAAVVWEIGDGPGAGRTVARLPGVHAFDVTGGTLIAAARGAQIRYVVPPDPPALSGELVVQSGHTQPVRDLAVSPDGTAIISTDAWSTVVWDLRTGRQVRRLPTVASRVAFAAGGALAVTLGDDLRVWSTTTWTLINIISTEAQPYRVAGQHQVAAATVTHMDGTVVAYNLLTSQELARTQAFLNSEIAVSGAGTHLAVMSPLGGVAVADFTTGTQQRFDLSPSDLPGPLAFTDDGAIVAVGLTTASGGLLRGWYTNTGAEAFSIPVTSPATSLAFSRDGRSVYSGHGVELHTWDIATGQLTSSVTTTYLPQPGEWTGCEVIRASASRDFIATGDRDGAVSLWQPGAATRFRVLRGKATPIAALDASPRDGSVMIADGRGVLHRWSHTAVEPMVELHTGPYAVHDLAWSPDAKRLALGRTDGVELVDPRSGDRIARLEAAGGAVGSIEWSRDGGRVSASSWERALVWDSKHRTIVTQVDASSLNLPAGQVVLSSALSADGSTLVVGTGDSMYVGAPRPAKVFVWDIAAGHVSRELDAEGAVVDVAVSKDGSRVFGAEQMGPVRVWNADTGAALGTAGYYASVVELAPDGRRFATGSLLGDVAVYNVETLASITSSTTSGAVTALGFTADGARLWIGTTAGSASLVDASDGARVVDVIATDQEGYLATIPDGYYWASLNALSAVAFRVGQRVLAFDQLDVQFNRPDLVLERIGGADADVVSAMRAGHERRKRRAGASAALVDVSQLPTLTLDSSTLPMSTSERLLTIGVTAGAADAGLSHLMVFVDGVPVFGRGGKPIGGTTWTGDVAVELLPGDNQVQLSAVDARGVESFRESVIVRYTPSAPVVRDLYVVTIGVSSYQDSEYDLRYAAKDARDVARLFADQRGAYRRAHELVLVDADVRRDVVIERVGAFLAAARTDDDVVVFLAGHGLRDEGYEYYFGTWDVDFLHPNELGLSFDDIEGLVDGIAPRRKLILVDSCFAGEAEATAAPTRDARTVGKVTVDAKRPRGLYITASAAVDRRSIEAEFAVLRRGTGAVVIASSSGYDVAFESPSWNNGAFTYTLIEGVRTGAADVDGDGNVGVAEMRSYVSDTVRAMTDGIQTPVARRHNLLLDFEVSRGLPPLHKIAASVTDGVYGRAALSPDGRRLAIGHRNGSIVVRDVRGGVADIILAGPPVSDGVLEFSSDGRLLVQAAAGIAPRVWTVDRGSFVELGDATRYLPRVSVSADGAVVAVVRSPKTYFYDVETRALTRVVSADPDAIAFRPDGTLVAIALSGATTIDPATGEVSATGSKELAVAASSAFAVALSADGAKVAYTGADQVEVRDTVTGARACVVEVAAYPGSVALSADGARMVLGVGNATVVRRTENCERVANLLTDSSDFQTIDYTGVSANGAFVFGQDASDIRLWPL